MKKTINDVILITGGSSGAGFEMAKQYCEMNKTVIICGRSEKKLKKAKEMVPALHIIQCDVTLKEDRQKIVDTILKEFGRIDMLVNNAGYADRYMIKDVVNLEQRTFDEWNTNYMAPLALIKLFLPLLEQSKGKIVNITSGLVYVPLYIEPNCCATKAALHSYTVSLRFHLKDTGISICEVFYPEIDTPFQQGHASKMAITPDVAAQVAVVGIEKGLEEVRVKRANLLYYLSRLIPKRMIKMLNSMVGERVKQVELNGVYEQN